LAGAIAASEGVTLSTHEKQARYWNLWLLYLQQIEIDNDPLLRQLDEWERPRICCAFAHAYRSGYFKTKGKNATSHQVVADTVDTAIFYVAKTFRDNDRPSPCHDEYKCKHPLLQQQIKGYRNSDGSKKQQKAATPGLIRKVYNMSGNKLQEAIGDLVGGAFFFACRSCEYSAVTGERRTKLLCKGNIVFIKDRRILHHSSPILHLADSVTLKFDTQKNTEQFAEVTQLNNGDPVLNPVVRWANVIRRLEQLPGCGQSTPINAYCDESGQIKLVNSKQVCERLRAAALAIGLDKLGYAPADIGTHSLRSGAAMAMYLSNVPVFTIMLIGRWSSDAFLRYIRRQVQEFSRGVSIGMIRDEAFYHVPTASSLEDPRTDRNALNFSGRGLLHGAPASTRARGAALSLWH
jgi:hypothetical protein